jgi:hypothetical protein
MAISVNCGVPAWLDDCAMSGQAPFRQYDIGTRVINVGTASVNQVPSGVFPSVGGMQVVASSGMNVTVNAGYCCVASSAGSLFGGYVFGLMTSAPFTVAAADPVNPRIDIVVAYVSDVGTSASFSAVEIITGTPATPAVAPSAPANSLILAQVAVAANVVSVTQGNITDTRSYVVAPGGILPIQNEAAAPAVPASQFMYNLASGQIVQGTGTAGNTATPAVLQWAPQMAVITSAVHAASAGVLTTAASVSVTVDGNTDIEIYAKWPGVVGSANHVLLTLTIDGTVVDSAEVVSTLGASPSAGGSVRYFTSSGQANTPAAGTHTVALKFQAGGAGTSTSDGVYAAAGAVTLLRCSPVAT